MLVPPTIFDATAACRKTLLECQTVERLMKKEWAENRLADFNLWASGIGASARNRASLDSRLALKSDSRDVILNLLQLLNTVIKDCLVLAQSDIQDKLVPEEARVEESFMVPHTPPQRPFSPWSDDSSSGSQSDTALNPISDTRLSEAMRDVESMLDQLARIAIAIRRSGARSRLQRADRTLNLEDYHDLGNYLIAVVLSQGPFSAEYTFSPEQIDPSKLTPVQLRLINCNLRRRNRFIYAQRHSKALDTSPPAQPPPEEVIGSKKDILEARPQQMHEQAMPSTSTPIFTQIAENFESPSVKTGTSASGVTDLHLLPQNPVPSQAATTQLSTTVVNLDYPNPPIIKMDSQVFKCPCCCQTLPIIFSEKTRWKKHIAEDLYPYTCVLPNCAKPEILYITKEAWLAHLLEDHQSVEYWICLACTNNVQFDQEDSFVEHILQEHHDTISNDQIPIVKSVCKRSAPAEISSCPLCTWPTAEDVEVDRGALIDHIAEDVHRFSLRSLPWGSDHDHESKERIEHGAAKVRDWLMNYELYLEAAQEIPHVIQAERLSVPHYFDLNEYFAETIERSSGSGTDNETMEWELDKLRQEGPLLYSDSSNKSTSSAVVSTPSINDYTVGWICATTTAYVAAKAFLDKKHESLEYGFANDNNIYTLGEIERHNVVITQPRKGEYGIAAAASTARDMVYTFPNIRIGLMVGIGGGAPSKKHDIRLGDIVVSASQNGDGGLFQYDFGKTIQNQEFQITGFLDQPSRLLRFAVRAIGAEYELKGHQLDKIIDSVFEKQPELLKKYQRPDLSSDRLYKSHIIHPSNDERSCDAACGNDISKLIIRHDRTDEDDNPAIHYGLIASANQLMKDALLRDRLSAEKDVLCFEMEAAGLMNRLPFLVIRGICDYSDSHKDMGWQGYAAMTAAAYAKDVLYHTPPWEVEAKKTVIPSTEEIDQNRNRHERVIAKLPFANGSTFDSFDGNLDPRCCPGTRIDLLHQINEWAENREGRSIFWLNGMAGTGKSTISRTIAKSLDEEGKLGASFFFKRSENNRNTMTMFFTTICAQLLVKIPLLTAYIEMTIETIPNIFNKSMEEQFEKLIYQPLSKTRLHLPLASKFIMVIDALDECMQDKDALLYLLLQTRDKWSPSLKIFITSRPEQQIRSRFMDMPEDILENMELYTIPQSIIKQDITTFLEYRFTEIRKKYVDYSQSFPSDWPGMEVISILVDMASPLFIFATTLCLFVEGPNVVRPDRPAQKVLEFQETKNDIGMDKPDAIYSPILNQLTNGRPIKAQKSLVERFRQIIGTILHLAEPLSRSSLASLLNLDSQQIERQLSSLYSVLNVPSSAESPIRLLHFSFRDFLVDPEKRNINPFWIDEKETHHMIMTKCLERMSLCLRENICNLDNHERLRTEIDSKIIINYLPPDMQYACRFWAHHLKESRTGINDNDPVHTFLQDHFLHWLESLSLLGRISDSIGLIRTMHMLVNDVDSEIYRFLSDAMRFIRRNSSIIDNAPLQLYSSALLSTPYTSIIRRTFTNKIPARIERLPRVESAWGPLLQTLEDHSYPVTAISFSPDGKMLASVSDDHTIKLWDPVTGALQQTLSGHSDWVHAISFSPDGKLLASGSDDHTIKLWDLVTGLQQTLSGHSGWVHAISFSPDGKLLASGSNDHTIKLWDPITGALQQTLRGHSGWVQAISFSPDGKLLASGSDDHTIKLWDPVTGLQQTLSGHSGWVHAISFSPDGKLLASGSNDHTIKLWDPITGALQQTLSGHSGWVQAISFSPDGKLLASGSEDHTIKLWDPITGALQQTLSGHSGWVQAISFSPDGKLLASGSEDHTVKLWDPSIGIL